jgi:hypothetical protein
MGASTFYYREPYPVEATASLVEADYAVSKLNLDYRKSETSLQTDFIIRVIF